MIGRTKFLVFTLLFFGAALIFTGSVIFSPRVALAVASQCSEAGVCIGGGGGGGGGTQNPATCSDGASNCGYTAPISVSVGCTIQLCGGQQQGSCHGVASFPSGNFTDGSYTGRAFAGQGTAVMNPVDDDGDASINGVTFYNSNPPGCSCGPGAQSGNNCGGTANGSGVKSVNIPEGATLLINVQNKCAAQYCATWGAGSASATSQATYCFTDATNATPSHVGSYIPSSDGHCQFVPTVRTLTVSKSGTGSGTVTSGPTGIACGSTCSAGFNHGTAVALSAVPSTNSDFGGWSGDCASDGTVIMTTNKACTATFTPKAGFSCQGGIPDSNSSLCPGTDQGLTQNTTNTLVMTCGTTPKCSYACNPNSQFIGSLIPGAGGYCSPLPVAATGTISVSAKYNDNTACTAFWTITGGASPLTGAGSGATYPNQRAMQSYVISLTSPSGATVSPAASQYLLQGGSITYNINCGSLYSCVGALPTGATSCNIAPTNSTTSWSQVSNCSSVACTYTGGPPAGTTGTIKVSAIYGHNNSACRTSWTLTGAPTGPISESGISSKTYPNMPANISYVVSDLSAHVMSPSSQTLPPGGESDFLIDCDGSGGGHYSCDPNTSTCKQVSGPGTDSCTVLGSACTGGVPFTCSITPDPQTIAPGGSTSYGLYLNPGGGWTGTTNVAITGAPAGVTYSGPATLSNVSSSGAINVTSQPFVAAGAYTVNAVLTQTGGSPNTANCSASLSVSSSCNVCSGVISPLPANATCSQYSNCKQSVSGSCSNNCVNFVCNAPYVRSGNTCNLPASNLIVSPSAASIQVGGTVEFCARKNGVTPEPANWTLSSAPPYQPPVQVVSTNPPTNPPALTGVSCVSLTGAGTQGSPVTVSATNADGSDSGTLSIGAPPACHSSTEVKPNTYDQATTVGGPFTFTAWYGCHEGYDIDVTNSATWSSLNPSIATVGNSYGTKGHATGVSLGRATISATRNGSTGNAPLTVTNIIHSACTNDPVNYRSCITVAGPGQSVCDTSNPNIGWSDCNTSAFCAADLSTGALSCVRGYWRPSGNGCQDCGGNGPHKGCVGTSCVSIPGPGLDRCATDVDCGGQSPVPSISFQANPSSGADPLSSALTATMNNGTPGTSNYTFWWNCNNTGTSVAAITAACGDPHNPAIGAKFDNVPANSQVANTIYHISSTAKVIVENGSSSLEGRKAIAVTTTGCPVGQIRPYGTCYQNVSGVYSCVATDACGVSQCANAGDCGGVSQACTLTANPKVISKNGFTTLTWTCDAGVTGCVLYDTTSGAKVSLGSVPSSCPLASSCGAVQKVKPLKTGQYVLECMKGGVKTIANVGVTVTSIIECNPNDPTCKQ